ncbi:neprilysin-21-like [Dermacentor andersoni]|uniref:neprilysin-21-like n=1 Tax=Dermacentor andersoni TaxID=34620 RepID=UPI0021555279|nr:neprilysin-21-like [Dermacentor andersoni]
MQRRLLALLGCIWLSFALGIVCTVFTVKLKIQTEYILRALESFYSQQQMTEEPAGECKAALCRWHSDYLWGRLNESVDPCQDFYAHVCSSAWFREGGRLSDQPYADFSVAQLLADVRDSLTRYGRQQPDGEHGAWSFPAQAVSLLRLCNRASSSPSPNSWNEVHDTLFRAGLGGWPYTDEPPADWSLLPVLAGLERDVGEGVLANVALRRDLSQADEYQVHVEPPETLLHQFLLHRRSSSSLVEYETQLAQLLCSAAGGNASGGGVANASSSRDSVFSRLAADLVAFEKRLEAIRGAPLLPLEQRYVRAGQLGAVAKWNWTAFLAETFHGTRTVVYNTTVVCDRCAYFGKATLLVQETPQRTLANYAAVRLVVLLSPLLPADEPWSTFVTKLSSRGLSGLTERLETCLGLLERTYRYGSAMLARMSLGRQFSTVYRTQYDRQLVALASSVLRSASLRAGRMAFLRADERRRAQSKLAAMVFQVFGTAPSLYWPALYYGVSSPLLRESEPLASAVALLRHTRRSYLSSRAPNLDLDAQYPLRVFGAPNSYYFPLRNLLFLPQSLVAFLTRVSNTIDAPFIPVVARPILTEALRAIDALDGRHVDDALALHTWWGLNSSARFERLTRCLLDQYAALFWSSSSGGVGANWREHVDAHALFRDVASVAPLLDAFRERPGSGKLSVRVSRARVLEPTQLFFVNFALSLCDHHGRGTMGRLQTKLGLVPSAVRVNLAVANSREFARAFQCKPNRTMAPSKRCRVW